MNREKLEDELAIAKLVEEYEAIRPIVEDKSTYTDEAMAQYRALNDQIAAARTAFKVKYPPEAPEEGDAVATPEPVQASTNG